MKALESDCKTFHRSALRSDRYNGVESQRVITVIHFAGLMYFDIDNRM